MADDVGLDPTMTVQAAFLHNNDAEVEVDITREVQAEMETQAKHKQ